MSDKKIKIVDKDNNTLLPITKGAYVQNNDGDYLGGVEANAEVNIIETVKVNGVALTPDSNRAVNVVIEDVTVPAYTLTRQAQADTGYSATYQLFKDGVAEGDKINIPKDLVVESGTVETCVQDDVPVQGFVVGDKYIDLVLANSNSAHIYILVSDLIDEYTAGMGLTLSGSEFSVNLADTDLIGAIEENGTKLVNAGTVYAALAEKQDAGDLVTVVDSSSTDDNFPSAKAVYDAIDLAISSIPAPPPVEPATSGSLGIVMPDNTSITVDEYGVISATQATIDSALSDSSENAVQNKIVKAAIDTKVTANVAISAGSATKVTFDEKGLVTGGAALSASDIPDVDSAKVASLTAYAIASAASAITTTDTLNEALGKLEYKVDNSQAAITGAASTVVTNDLTASRVTVSDTNGKIAASTVTTTELDYLTGVTSAIQTQLDSKLGYVVLE